MKSKHTLGMTDRVLTRLQHCGYKYNSQSNITRHYTSTVDYEKAFDSLDRDTLWKILRQYGVPMKLVNMIKNSYEGMSCRVIHNGQPTKNFEIRIGVRQGCLLSPFLLVIDWIMKTETKGKRNGIQWKIFTQLDDLDFFR